jgi:hypothetical protein
MTENDHVKRRRGRPVARWLTLDEVAEIVRGDAEVIGRLLDKVPQTLPGAICDDGVWKVPEKALRAILGAATGPLPQMATVGEVAECLRRDVKTVYGWLKVMKGKEQMLPHKRVLGTILIEARAVLALPPRMPGTPSSFFSAKQGGKSAA